MEPPCGQQSAKKQIYALKVAMNLSRKFAVVSSLCLISVMPAIAGVTVSSPGNRADVQSPFELSATGVQCSSKTVTSLGYSLDSSSNTTILKGQNDINVKVSAPLGNHVLHVKAWGRGVVCVTDVAINVIPSSLIPADALSVSNIQSLENWGLQHDPATGGGTSGATGMVSSPAKTGTARAFVTTFLNNGGHLYHVTFGDDTESTNFVYDTWLYLDSSATHVANIEMDLNQVMANGQTVIYGFQCDGWSGTWDYSGNLGTAKNPSGRWMHTKAPCNPRSWTQNVWHHVQIAYSRNDAGMVTYKSVWFDGREQPINATVFGARSLGWGPVLLANFQVDGRGSGTATIFMDGLTIYRW